MLLSQLSKETQAFFYDAFDLNQDLNLAICHDEALKNTYPLHFAVIKKNIFVIQELLDCGADVNQLDYAYANKEIFGSLTPLMYAASGVSLESKKKMINALIALKADVYYKNEKNESLITYVVFIQDINLFQFLLEQGVDPFYDMETMTRLKFRLAAVMEEKPYQFKRMLRLLSDYSKTGAIYEQFESDFLKMIDKSRYYIQQKNQLVRDPSLNRETGGAENTEASVNNRGPIVGQTFYGAKKLLKSLNDKEKILKDFRVELNKELFQIYLKMTSKWTLQKKKSNALEQEALNKKEIFKKKLPSDLEKYLAVNYFGFSYEDIRSKNKGLSNPLSKNNASIKIGIKH